MTHSTKSAPKPKFSFEAIGTHWQIEYVPGRVSDQELEQNILDRIETFDKTYSRFREDSLVYSMAKEAGTYEFPADSQPLFEMYKELYEVTDGLVSPLVGSTLADAGYDAEYSLKFKRKTMAPPLDVLEIKGNVITTHQPVWLDFGAAGKGYLVDIICELMKSLGVTEAVVDAGGDIAAFSPDPAVVEIALQHPEDRQLAIGTARIQNQSLCGSSIHVRNWGTHHHIINPQSAESPTHIRALWVMAENALLADGLSTALFFVSPAQLKQRFSFEYAIIKDDYSLEHSTDFPAEFFDES
jgi:thiamine biosynthesis lipoprotein